jgi:hypothetical protein
VLPLTEIRDLEVMRQIAVLLERENPKLHAKVDTLLTELAKFRSGDGAPNGRAAGVPAGTAGPARADAVRRVVRAPVPANGRRAAGAAPRPRADVPSDAKRRI